MPEIVNVVGSGSLDSEFDLERVAAGERTRRRYDLEVTAAVPARVPRPNPSTVPTRTSPRVRHQNAARNPMTARSTGYDGVVPEGHLQTEALIRSTFAARFVRRGIGFRTFSIPSVKLPSKPPATQRNIEASHMRVRDFPGLRSRAKNGPAFRTKSWHGSP